MHRIQKSIPLQCSVAQARLDVGADYGWLKALENRFKKSSPSFFKHTLTTYFRLCGKFKTLHQCLITSVELNHLANQALVHTTDTMPTGESSTRSREQGIPILPVPYNDRIAGHWRKILNEIVKKSYLPHPSMIGCFRYGPDLHTTVVIFLNYADLSHASIQQNV